MKHNLDVVDEKYRHIVEVLLSYEDVLSDGYKYYCDAWPTSDELKRFENDAVLCALVDVAKEILGEDVESSKL